MRSMIVFLLTLVFGFEVHAEGPPAGDGEIRYVALQPSFVCNFGMAENGHLMYLKTSISIRVSSREAEVAARSHMPALRNSLVLLLSRQDEASVSTGNGREGIRAQALEELNGILEAEEGYSYIDDLMFTNFIVQR
ncbi:MAG: flagellar basal body-associated FliL family protein [Pseudomonadales bacterium]